MTNLQPSLAVISKAEAAAELLRRRRARSNLQDFIVYINPDYIVSEFSRTVCKQLDQFLLDMARGERPVLILGAPPQHGKSDIVSRYFPSYVFGHYPDLRIGGLSYGSDLASDMNRDVQRIMLGEAYGLLFPNSSLNKKRVVTAEVEAKRNSETFEIVGRKGSYVSQGVGGPLTGKKLDLGIIDDPIKNSKEALSTTVKDAVWNWYTSTFLTRLSKNSGQIIMATRWALDDLSGRIEEKNPKAKVLKFPAIGEDGGALVPELHPIEKLLETKGTMSEYFWSAMYQQNPTILGGGLIKTSWFGSYSILPKLKYTLVFGDTAQKTAEVNDYSVFEHWGMGEDGYLYLIDLIRGKWEADDLKKRAVAFWEKAKSLDNGRCRWLGIEDKSSGTGLIQQLRREASSEIPVKAIPRTKDKYTRLMDVQGYLEAGYVKLPSSAPWLSDFLAECESLNAKFSGHDDQIDPMIDAISNMLDNKKVSILDVL